MASRLFERPAAEPSVAELDATIEASDEWRANVAAFGAAGAEEFRELLRTEERIRRMKEFPERVLMIDVDGQQGLITPLLNIQWDFEKFMGFANRVADVLIQHLEGDGEAATVGSGR